MQRTGLLQCVPPKRRSQLTVRRDASAFIVTNNSLDGSGHKRRTSFEASRSKSALSYPIPDHQASVSRYEGDLRRFVWVEVSPEIKLFGRSLDWSMVQTRIGPLFHAQHWLASPPIISTSACSHKFHPSSAIWWRWGCGAKNSPRTSCRQPARPRRTNEREGMRHQAFSHPAEA
jgi:hypothetical protein